MGSVASQNQRGQRLRQIRGMPPRLLELGSCCAFRARCDYSTCACEAGPAETAIARRHHVRCFNPQR
jgi:peptide/nickel transport system ATP-binding protein